MAQNNPKTFTIYSSYHVISAEQQSSPWIIDCDSLQISQLREKSFPILRDALIQTTKLKEFKFYCPHIDSISLIDLCQALKSNKSITHLQIWFLDLTNKADALFDALKENKYIQILSFNGNKLEDSAWHCVNRMMAVNTSISSIYFYGFDLRSLGGVFQTLLSQSTTLRTLKINNSRIHDESARLIVEGLKSNTTLTALDLDQNSIGTQPFISLASIIKERTHLTDLSLRNNNIVAESSGLIELGLMIKSNRLTRLDISGCLRNATDNGKDYIFESLKSAKAMKNLTLDNNNISGRLCPIISEWLKISSIEYLNLGNNSIGSVGCKTLCESLKNHPTLSHLELWSNKIDNEGIKYISEVLSNNNVLHTLNLASNDEISVDGCKFLSEALKVNNTLTSLYITNPNIRWDCIKIFNEALETNQTLTEIRLSSTIEGDPIDLLKKRLAENKRRKEMIKSDWWLIVNNIARRPQSFELFPEEIWRLIFKHMPSHLGLTSFSTIAQKIFNKTKICNISNNK